MIAGGPPGSSVVFPAMSPEESPVNVILSNTYTVAHEIPTKLFIDPVLATDSGTNGIHSTAGAA